jgi:hypothetical protein
MSTIDEHSPGTIIQTGPVTLPPASTGLQSPDKAVATTAREACTNLTSASHSQLRAAAPATSALPDSIPDRPQATVEPFMLLVGNYRRSPPGPSLWQYAGPICVRRLIIHARL